MSLYPGHRLRPLQARLSALRVAKKLSPEQDGAKKFARRYGEALVCVRHRHDPTGTIRYTTVELLIEENPIASRAEHLVAVRVGPQQDKAFRALLMACGAQWDPKAKLWLMPRRVAKNLKLLTRIVSRPG